jgi:hypothetical protein
MPLPVSLAQLLPKEITPWMAAAIVIGLGFGFITFAIARKMRRWKNIPFRNTADSDVFLSYKSDDAILVRFLAEQMMAQGINVWFNEYRIVLRGWDEDFEQGLKAGVATCRRAAFFTNEKWTKSQWCVNAEAIPLLARLAKDDCIEVGIPPHPAPHQKVPPLEQVQQIEASNMDKWTLLKNLYQALGFTMQVSTPPGTAQRPLRGRVNDVPYELNIHGWSAHGDARPSMGNLVLPRLVQTDNGTMLSVNIIAGKRGWERKEINDLDDRIVFQNLRNMACHYFQGFPLAGECIGVHLVFQTGFSHGAFTYWGRNAWCRKYGIVLPAGDGGADIEFTFTCSVYGPFSEFCRVAWRFEELVTSLQYGKERSSDWAV